MYKILTSLLFIFSTFALSADDTYVFEAKGEFAKDLKALVEKYSKEGKIEAKVYKKDDSIIGSIFGNNDTNTNGKEVYTKKCSSCHGVKGEESPSPEAKSMTNMSRDEIELAIRSYRNDSTYGGSMKMLMQTSIIGLKSSELNAIINFVHGKNMNNKQIDKNQNSNTPQTSYLK